MPGESDSKAIRGGHVKRIHLVGKSEDEKSLIFASIKGDKAGSFEVPITRKLRNLVGGGEDAPSSAAADGEPLTPGRDHVRVLPTPQRAEGEGASSEKKTRARGLAPGGFEKATGFGSGIPELRGVRALIGGGNVAAGGHRVGLAAVPEPSGEALADESVPPSDRREQGSAEPEDPVREGQRSVRVSGSRQKLTAAEIQALLRAGRNARSVAGLAGASLEWVQRLDETIQMERIAVVRQLLGAHLTRDRHGKSELPVGEAILANLRKRRVRFPERVLERGWSASRPRGKEWRVRFTYRFRDKQRRADWSYDPRTGEVLALTTTAVNLGWVPPTGSAPPSSRDGGKARDPKRRP
jgi:hypothetical protein